MGECVGYYFLKKIIFILMLKKQFLCIICLLMFMVLQKCYMGYS